MKRIYFPSVVALLASLVSLLCCAKPVSADSSPVVARIINGTSISNRNSAVAQVNLHQYGSRFVCTGALITPRVVLTAWHCVGRRAKYMSVKIGGKRFSVARFKVHPDVEIDAQGLIKNDVALLYLARPSSAPRLSLLTSRAPVANDAVEVMGYGVDELGMYGVLRDGMARIDAVSSEFVQTLFDSEKQANSCNGDSGGPAILTYRDPVGVLRTGIIGTVSTGTTSNCM
ncbi:MAG: hypothetical protein EBZ48_05430, partial [Proteobacteria bacterium]|nr:hypothetical protein [Pseudomonadota bacterium]